LGEALKQDLCAGTHKRTTIRTHVHVYKNLPHACTHLRIHIHIHTHIHTYTSTHTYKHMQDKEGAKEDSEEEVLNLEIDEGPEEGDSMQQAGRGQKDGKPVGHRGRGGGSQRGGRTSSPNLSTSSTKRKKPTAGILYTMFETTARV